MMKKNEASVDDLLPLSGGSSYRAGWAKPLQKFCDKTAFPKLQWSFKNQESTKKEHPISEVKAADTQTPEEAMSIIYNETFDCPEPLCSYSTPSKRQFQKHVQIHSDKRPYTCFVCDYTFKRSDSLRQHLLTHSGEKPYACGLCPMHFTHRNSRNRHRLKHKENN